jgi:collagen type I alpha
MANFIWIAGSGNFGTDTNWNVGTAVPGPLDSAFFDNGVGGTISGSGSVEELLFYNTGVWSLASGTSLEVAATILIGESGGGSAGDGTLTIGIGSTITTDGAIYVGNYAGDNTTLTVSGGGVLDDIAPGNTVGNSLLVIGYSAASGTLAAAAGSVVVTGTGSLIDLGLNGFSLGGAGGGNGAMTVSQGGSVIAATLNSNVLTPMAIGSHGNGTLTVTDAGSQVTAVGEPFVGSAGTGTLAVEGGASFLVEPDAKGLAGLAVGVGRPNSTGGIGIANVDTGGVITSQGYVIVGDLGAAGQLTVNDGTVQVGTTLEVGNGGTLSNSVTEAGNGILTIGTGGTVELTGTARTSGFGVYLGNSNIGTAGAADASATVSGAGAVLNTNGNGLAVANYGTAALTVSQGGSVASGTPNSNLVVALAIGKQGSGAVIVTDANSQLTADGGVFVGRAGTGSLIVENQGSVVIGLDGLDAGGLSIGGFGTTSSGALYVGGTGTALVTSGGDLFSLADIDVGQNGATGTLTVQNGTVGAAGQLLIGNSITLTPGATLISPTGTTTVMSTTVETGTGVVNVGAGGTVQVQGLTEDTGGSIVVTGGSLLVSASGSATGSVNGFGVITGQLTSDGSIVATGGTLDFTGGLLGSGGITIDGGAALRSDSLLSDGQLVTFATSASTEDLILGAPQAANAFSIANWQYGDEIVFTGGETVTGAQWLGSGTLVVDSSAGAMDFTNVGLAAGTTPNFTTGSDFVELVPCFVAGTSIATPTGEVAVENLSIGEPVRTVLGATAVPITWIGRRDVDCTHHPQPQRVWPVRVVAGAFGPGRPHTDLFLSPDHGVYVEEVLIPIKYLINGRTITQTPLERVVYHHVELAQHDVLLAEGLPAESFLDLKDGSNYTNRPGPVRLYPDYSARMWEAFGCARLVVTGPELDAARALVARFASHRAAA